MADEPTRMLDRDATEDERHPVAECVGIDTEPDPELIGCHRVLPRGVVSGSREGR
jgi:hypothetical protein